jgi:hypothetical protein
VAKIALRTLKIAPRIKTLTKMAKIKCSICQKLSKGRKGNLICDSCKVFIYFNEKQTQREKEQEKITKTKMPEDTPLEPETTPGEEETEETDAPETDPEEKTEDESLTGEEEEV